jgi:dihydropyrimidinase
MSIFDVVIRGGRVATASDVFEADVGIVGDVVVEIGHGLPNGVRTIDATGKLVLPGGVDSHAHIEQIAASGLMTADDFESATISAAFGGTTSVLSFAAQHRGMNLQNVVSNYHSAAKRGAVIDYAFHMIVTDPNVETLKAIPDLVREGYASIKIYTTYERLRLDDRQILDVLFAARAAKAMVCAHAENDGMIAWLTDRLLQKGYTAPKFGAVSHPRSSEEEAIRRLIVLAEFSDQPVMIFHVSTAEGASVVREARERGVKVFAETCPHYLLLTAADVDKPGLEGAKFCCSPPLRTRADQEALWTALARRDIQVISSDHAPYRFDETGKLKKWPATGVHRDSKRLAGARDAVAAYVRRDGGGPTRERCGLRRRHVDPTGENLWPLSTQRGDRRGKRRRHRDLGSRSRIHLEGGGPA